MNMTTPLECFDYKVVKLKFKDESETVHHVLMKEHSVRETCSKKPPKRTLFILGTPPFVTEEAYKNAFSPFGSVEEVFFQQSPSSMFIQENESQFFKDYNAVEGFKVAYVVFQDPKGLSKALLSSNVLILSKPESSILTGITKWCRQYNKQFINHEDLQNEIDSYMKKYDQDVAEQERREKEEMQPDEDGWIKVTKKGRHPGFARKESVHNKIMKKEDQKKAKKQLLNFYRFQIRQSKMDHLVKLREKFEEDKKKIELMKQNRKFKPF
ncbi:ribosomal RNA-processing protein 7 homolog A isoform X1 [Cimex lectularius]|uniref:Ribosomal RNA-processing protein 7 C-terminal domain-containing protein n=1 Tax=Cimex lectularius TaxID=79782 RepID=A0A8I6S898_CIMLE|nr:ribosomal RNA-processing protein 7 homolog A isoform X1 [Cimex lectularius]